MRRAVAFLAALAASTVGAPFGVHAAGPTPVEGTLPGSVTWSKENSPYVVTGDVTVPTGAMLTIEAGTVVQFEYVDKAKPYTRRAVLEVRGALDVAGARDDLVRFGVAGDRPEIGAWGGIWVNGGSAAVSHAEIAYAERGIYALDPVALTVRDSIFHRSWTGIYLERAPEETVVERNSITGNEEGVFAEQSYGRLSWNLISNNVWGIFSSDNERLDITHNDIKSNQYGLLIDGRGGASATYNDFSVHDANDYAVFVRSGAPAKIEQNNFHFSSELADANSIFWMMYIQGTEDVAAPHNWWGTVPDEPIGSAAAFIEAYTFDRRDVGGVGRFNYEPFARAPVEGTVDDLQPPVVRVLESPVFSPNDDGRVDVAEIVYTMSESASSVTVAVIDEHGLTGEQPGAVLWEREWRAAGPGVTGSDPTEVTEGRRVVVWDGTWRREGETEVRPAEDLCDFPTKGRGSYRIRVTAQDRSRPNDPAMRGIGEGVVYVDCAPPVLSVSNIDIPEDGSPVPATDGLLAIVGTVEDDTAVGLVVTLQGRQPATHAAAGRIGFSGRAWLPSPGIHPVVLAAVDGAGNRAELSFSFDYSPPVTIDVDSPTNETSVVVQGTVAGAFGDRVESVRVRAAGGHPAEAAFAPDWVPADIGAATSSGSRPYVASDSIPLRRGANTLQVEAWSASELLGSAAALLEMDPYVDQTREARFLSGRSMITIAMTGSSDHAAVLAVPNPDVGRWQWDEATGEGRYVSYGEAGLEPFAPGRGFWLQLEEPYDSDVTGDVVDPAVDFYPVSLREGWNQIGNPFLDAVPWDDLRVKPENGREAVSIRDAVADGLVANTAWGYWSGTYRAEGFGGRLDPWAGYWVRAYADVELHVPGPAEAALGGRSAPAVGAVTRSTSAIGRGWSFHLEAWPASPTDGGGASGGTGTGGAGSRSGDGAAPHAHVRLGVRDEASAAFDPLYDAEAPPPVEGSPELAVIHDDWGVRSGKYAVDVRGAAGPIDGTPPGGGAGAPSRPSELPAGTGWAWDVLVSDGQWLTWPDAERVPPSVSLFLVDEVADVVVNLREADGYALSGKGGGAEHRVRIVALSGDGPLELSRLWVYPNPTSLLDGVTIEYTVSRPSRVRVRIDDAIGRPVLWPTGGAVMSAGRHAFHWDGRNSGGRLVANGIYVVTVSAIDDSGRRTRAIAKIGVLK